MKIKCQLYVLTSAAGTILPSAHCVGVAHIHAGPGVAWAGRNAVVAIDPETMAPMASLVDCEQVPLSGDGILIVGRRIQEGIIDPTIDPNRVHFWELRDVVVLDDAEKPLPILGPDGAPVVAEAL